jgi:cytoskeletal protein CcmA (bactofilin family)
MKRRLSMSSSCRKLVAVLVVVVLMGFLVVTGVHAEGRSGDQVIVKADEVVGDDLYATGREIVIDGTVKGDLVALAQSITINGTVEGDVVAMAQTIVINGSVKDDTRVAAQALVVRSSGKVGDDVAVASFSFESQPGSTIGGDVWYAAYQAKLDGDVTGNVKGGSNGLEIAGHVKGNVEASVGDPSEESPIPFTQFMPTLPGGLTLPSVKAGLTIAQGAEIAGSLTYTSRAEAQVAAGAVTGKITRQEPPVTKEEAAKAPTTPLSASWWLDQVRRLVRLLIVGLLLAFLAPGWLRRTSDALHTRPWRSLGWGVLSPFAVVLFLLIIAVVVALIAMLLSYVIGAAALVTILLSSFAGTLVIVYLLVAFYVSALIAGHALGDLLLIRAMGGRPSRPLWAMLVGIAIVWVLTLIPYVGGFFGLVLALFGLGAIWLAFRARRVELAPVEARPTVEPPSEPPLEPPAAPEPPTTVEPSPAA